MDVPIPEMRTGGTPLYPEGSLAEDSESKDISEIREERRVPREGE